MTQLDPEDISIMAHSAWELFYTTMSGMFKYVRGQGDSFHKNKYASVFISLIKKCIDSRVNFQDYIPAAIDILAHKGRSIIPRDLLEASVFSAYKKQRLMSLGGTPEGRYKTQKIDLIRLVEAYKDRQATEEDILLTAMLSFEPWFRVFGINPMSEKVVGQYGKQAWDALYNEPELREFIEESMPKEFERFQSLTTYFDYDKRIL